MPHFEETPFARANAELQLRPQETLQASVASQRRTRHTRGPPSAGGGAHESRWRGIGLLEVDAARDRAGPLVPRLDADLSSCRRFDDPLELDEVSGGLVVQPPGGRALLRAALQLSRLRLDLTADEPGVVRQ